MRAAYRDPDLNATGVYTTKVASKVGTRLGKDPTKLRFWLCPTGGDTPRDIIKRNEKQTLHEIIESYLYSSAITPAFWVEVMDISYVELATKRMLRVTYLDANLREKVVRVCDFENGESALMFIRTLISGTNGCFGFPRKQSCRCPCRTC